MGAAQVFLGRGYGQRGQRLQAFPDLGRVGPHGLIEVLQLVGRLSARDVGGMQVGVVGRQLQEFSVHPLELFPGPVELGQKLDLVLAGIQLSHAVPLLAVLLHCQSQGVGLVGQGARGLVRFA